MATQLKLLAGDTEDLSVVSACMQDALISFADARFVPAERRFILVARRFKWENCPEFMKRDPGAAAKPCTAYERVNCVLCFDDVTGVRLRDLERPEDVQVLELLAITHEEDEGEGGGRGDQAVNLLFAGGGAIRLEVNRILCHLEDLGQPWPTKWRPSHPLEGTD